MTTETKAPKLQKKISIAKIYGKVNAAVISNKSAGTGEIHVMRVLGSATGIKEGVSDYGDWKALTGQFRGIHPETGEITDAATCFMPDLCLDMVAAEISRGAVAVDFAFDVFATLDETAPVGFTYRAVPLLQASGESPITRIANKLQALLPAPAKDEKKGGKK